MIHYILFVPGFFLLLKGGDLLVDGACAIARRMGVSDLVVALTIVAFGTSAPELIVSIFAATTSHPDIAVGNAVGSNTMNTMLILGIAGVICPLTVSPGTVWKEIPFSFLAVVVVGVLGNVALVAGEGTSELSRVDGIILTALMGVFLIYVFRLARRTGVLPQEVPHTGKKLSAGKGTLMVIIGIAALNFGADWIVNGAVQMARALNISETVIALTVISVGTSLPELATSAVAAKKGNADMAVGNVVGSNIFNMFWVLGIAAMIRPLPFQEGAIVDVAVAAGSSALLFLFMFLGRKPRTLERYEGVIFLVLYAGYLAYLVTCRVR